MVQRVQCVYFLLTFSRVPKGVIHFHLQALLRFIRFWSSVNEISSLSVSESESGKGSSVGGGCELEGSGCSVSVRGYERGPLIVSVPGSDSCSDSDLGKSSSMADNFERLGGYMRGEMMVALILTVNGSGFVRNIFPEVVRVGQ